MRKKKYNMIKFTVDKTDEISLSRWMDISLDTKMNKKYKNQTLWMTEYETMEGFKEWQLTKKNKRYPDT